MRRRAPPLARALSSVLLWGLPRSPAPALGSVYVSVPKAHTLGEVDRPRQSSLFGITYNGDEDPQHHFIIQRIEKLDRGASVTDIRNAVDTSKGFKRQGSGISLTR
jgi:hypothetical protein